MPSTKLASDGNCAAGGNAVLSASGAGLPPAEDGALPGAGLASEPGRPLDDSGDGMFDIRGRIVLRGANSRTFSREAPLPRSALADKSKNPVRTLAAQADRHALYERSVQDPDGDVKFFARTYRKIRGHDPVSLREDFCGTAALCAAWARSSPERTALGVDLSQETMNWGIARHLVPAGRDVPLMRRTWSVTQTRNIGWRAFFRISMIRSLFSSR